MEDPQIGTNNYIYTNNQWQDDSFSTNLKNNFSTIIGSILVSLLSSIVGPIWIPLPSALSSARVDDIMI